MGRQRKPDYLEITVKIKHGANLKRKQTVILRPVCASSAFLWVIETLEATKIVIPDDEPIVDYTDEPATETLECGE